MDRLIESVVGHENQLTQLLQMYESNRLPHAMLFVGPSGVGKKTVALALAQVLVCDSEHKPCGVCGPCIRMGKQQSESLFLIQPDPEYSKPAIKVEDIRTLLEKLSLAGMGHARVVIIEQAHLMNEQASNALLKTLEEPGDNLFFILIANEETLLLSTIRSRTQTVRFMGLRHDQQRRLKPNHPDWAYRSSRGQMDRLEMLTGKQGVAERKEALELLERFFFDEDLLLHDDWRKPLKEDRDWALFNLRCWMQIVRDTLIVKTQAEKFILNTDQQELLKKLQDLPTEKLMWFSAQLLQATRDISGYQDATLVVESLRVKYARLD